METRSVEQLDNDKHPGLGGPVDAGPDPTTLFAHVDGSACRTLGTGGCQEYARDEVPTGTPGPGTGSRHTPVS